MVPKKNLVSAGTQNSHFLFAHTQTPWTSHMWNCVGIFSEFKICEWNNKRDFVVFGSMAEWRLTTKQPTNESQTLLVLVNRFVVVAIASIFACRTTNGGRNVDDSFALFFISRRAYMCMSIFHRNRRYRRPLGSDHMRARQQFFMLRRVASTTRHSSSFLFSRVALAGTNDTRVHTTNRCLVSSESNALFFMT